MSRDKTEATEREEGQFESHVVIHKEAMWFLIGQRVRSLSGLGVGTCHSWRKGQWEQGMTVYKGSHCSSRTGGHPEGTECGPWSSHRMFVLC